MIHSTNHWSTSLFFSWLWSSFISFACPRDVAKLSLPQMTEPLYHLGAWSSKGVDTMLLSFLHWKAWGTISKIVCRQTRLDFLNMSFVHFLLILLYCCWIIFHHSFDFGLQQHQGLPSPGWIYLTIIIIFSGLMSSAMKCSLILNNALCL